MREIFAIKSKFCENYQIDTSFVRKLDPFITELIVLLVIRVYDSFEGSLEYRHWRECERSYSRHQEVEGDNQFRSLAPSEGLWNLAFRKLSGSSVRKLVSISWFKTILKCLEALLIPLSVITLNPQRPNSIVFGNEAYLRFIGYQKVGIRWDILTSIGEHHWSLSSVSQWNQFHNWFRETMWRGNFSFRDYPISKTRWNCCEIILFIEANSRSQLSLSISHSFSLWSYHRITLWNEGDQRFMRHTSAQSIHWC